MAKVGKRGGGLKCYQYGHHFVGKLGDHIGYMQLSNCIQGAKKPEYLHPNFSQWLLELLPGTFISRISRDALQVEKTAIICQRSP